MANFAGGNEYRIMKENRILMMGALIVALLIATGCGNGRKQDAQDGNAFRQELQDSLTRIVRECPGEIGIVVIVGNDAAAGQRDGMSAPDTVTVNNQDKYPMMSVFKLHQAVALCRELDRKGISLDTVISMHRDSLDADTWSPMLKEHPESVIKLPVRELMEYALQLSDNNASNEMFRQLMSPAECDSLIAIIMPRDSFKIKYTESAMKRDHALAYANHTSPVGAASLIYRLFTDSILSQGSQDFIRDALLHCGTGVDRISLPLQNIPGVTIAHKTGSGYRNEQGVLAAHNDVAFVHLPDGTHYALAVFVKDFPGTEADASAIISRISQTVYNSISTY